MRNKQKRDCKKQESIGKQFSTKNKRKEESQKLKVNFTGKLKKSKNKENRNIGLIK